MIGAGFVVSNAMTDKEPTNGGIIVFVAFLWGWVAKKHTSQSFGSKFVKGSRVIKDVAHGPKLTRKKAETAS